MPGLSIPGGVGGTWSRTPITDSLYAFPASLGLQLLIPTTRELEKGSLFIVNYPTCPEKRGPILPLVR